MKKAFILLISTLILTSCFGGGDSGNTISENDAKKDLLEQISKEKEGGDTNSTIDNGSEEDIKFGGDDDLTSGEIEKEAYVKIEDVTQNKFIEVSNIIPQNNLDTIEIKGDVLENVDKIIVNFENKDSKFKNDSYKLQSFKTGDKTFIYNAINKVHNVLDYGLNTYIIEAYVGYEVSKTKVEIYIPKPEGSSEDVVKVEETMDTETVDVEEGVSYVEKTLFNENEDSKVINFPEGGVFGDIVSLSNDSLIYSNIDDLVIKLSGNKEVTCNDLTDVILDTYDVSYWNTCRDLNGKGISYNLLYVEDGKYSYEKHFYNYSNGITGVVSLDKGEGVTLKNISAKNSEFKEIDYSRKTKIPEELFKLITK